MRWAGFSALMLIRRTALHLTINLTIKLSAEIETTPIANVLLGTVYSFILSIIYFSSPSSANIVLQSHDKTITPSDKSELSNLSTFK